MENPKKLDFIPQKSVEWYDVRQLAQTGLKAVISSVLGSFNDKREIQAALDQNNTKLFYDTLFSSEDTWIDYISDMGDGFNATYTMARFLAQETLDFKNHKTYCGGVVVMGGDQVYPTASREEYDNRFKGPYKKAFSEEEPGSIRNLFALPGNHDWYDGLSTFLKIFGQQRYLGRLKTQQDRSYFALQFPYNVWLFGIDVQLDSDIDKNQLDYFKRIMDNSIPNGSRIIVCTAEPAWVYSTQKLGGIRAYNNLRYFEENYANNPSRDIKQVLTLSGDLHHYSRYKTEDGTNKITAGGGGAFLHPTHNLRKTISKLREGEAKLQKTFPSQAASRKLIFGNWLFAFKNKGFSFFMACLYLLCGWILNGSLLVMNDFENTGYSLKFSRITDHLFLSQGLFLILIVLFAVMYSFAEKDPSNPKTGPVGYKISGFVHGLLQAFMILFSYWALDQLNFRLGIKDSMTAYMETRMHSVVILLEMIVCGYFVSSTLLGWYLLLSNLLLGSHDNEAFSSLKNEGYKNFIRIHITKEELTVYPIGVEKTAKWKYDEQSGKFKTNDKLECHLIEEPVSISLL